MILTNSCRKPDVRQRDMKYEEQKNRMMKTFEEIYRDAAVRNGCNAGKTFARVMFEEEPEP